MRHALVAIVVAGCWTSSPPAKDPEPPGGTWRPEPGAEPTAKRPSKQSCDEVSCLLDPDPPCCAKFAVKKPPRPPPPPPPPPSIPPTLDRASIAATMSSIKGDVVRCGALAPSTKGTLKVKVSVSPSGAAVASIQQSLAGAIDACVVTAIGRARFPRAQSPTTFVYPYVF